MGTDKNRARSEEVGWLYDLQNIGIKLGLDNIRALLEHLQHPEDGYPKVLVGGTNGKGSVCAMLEAMLRRNGQVTGMFTSPHLVRPNERVRINGQDISDTDLHRILRHLRRTIESGMAEGCMEVHPSFFETITGTALYAFNEAGVDVGILEVGMGGRLDATNATSPAVSVVTTIDLDHTKSLGGTLELIAAEKGGIVKPGRPLVCGVKQASPRKVLQEICRERDAEFINVAAEASISEDGRSAFTVNTRTRSYPGLSLSLSGGHQRENAMVAIVAMERLAETARFSIDPAAVASGLAGTRWAGRLQEIPGRPSMLLDAAHNAAGAGTLREFLSRRAAQVPPVLIFGATREKDLSELLLPLAPHVGGLVASKPSVSRAMEPHLIAGFGTPYFNPVELHPDPADALEAARRMAGPDGEILVAGSLYLVGNVMAAMEGGPVPGPVAM